MQIVCSINRCLYFWDEVLCILFTSSSPCLSHRFGRCTHRPSSGGWNISLTEVDWSSSTSHILVGVSYLHRSPPNIELTLYACVTGSNQRLYPLCHVSLRTSAYESPGIINLMSSATIFTCAHIAILLLSLHFFTITAKLQYEHW